MATVIFTYQKVIVQIVMPLVPWQLLTSSQLFTNPWES